MMMEAALGLLYSETASFFWTDIIMLGIITLKLPQKARFKKKTY